jgi:HSP20 family protein
MERQYGSFYRRLPVPGGTAAETITAAFKDGVLEVRLPKPAAAKPVATQIKVV